MMRQRIYWADQAKALAIFLMVLCHYGLSNMEWVKFIYIWHMPLFFFISGYFDKGVALDKNVFVRNFRTLIIPYFFFRICACSICWISPYLHPELYNNDGLCKTFTKAFVGMLLMQDRVRPYAFMPMGPLWFLVALFEVKIIFSAICGTIGKEKSNTIIFLVLLCLYSFFAYYKFFSTDAALMAFPIYAIGFAFNKCHIIERVTNNWQCAGLFTTGILYLLCIGMKNGKISMDGADFGNSLLMFYINAFIGSLTFIFMFKTINLKWIWVSLVGTSTLSILGTHGYLAIISKIIGVGILSLNANNEPLWFIIVFSVIGIIFGVCCNNLILKYIPAILGK